MATGTFFVQHLVGVDGELVHDVAARSLQQLITDAFGVHSRHGEKIYRFRVIANDAAHACLLARAGLAERM